MIIDELISAEAMRSVFVSQMSNTQAAQIKGAVLDLMRFSSELLEGKNNPVTLAQLQNMESYALIEYLPSLNGWVESLAGALDLFAGDEAEFQVNTLNDQLKEQHFITSIPAAEQIAGAALSSVLPKTNRTLQDAMNRYAPRQYNLFISTARAAFAGGITGQELATKIYGGRLVTNYREVMGLGAITRAQAQTLASTATSMISSRAKDEIKRENSDLIIGHKWLSTLDSKTSRTCASLDGREFYYRDNPDAPMPPAHYGCLLPDSKITSALGVSSAFKRVFKGEVITIKTVSGNSVTITPNHPVLTQRGWVAAQNLNLRDKAVKQGYREGVALVDRDNDAGIPSVSDVFESLSTSSHVKTRKVPISAPDFHGDGVKDGEVNIVTADVQVPFISDFIGVKESGEFILNGAASDGLPKEASLSHFTKFIHGRYSALSGLMGGSGQSLDFLFGGSLHSCKLLLGSVSGFDSSLSEDSGNNIGRDTNFSSYACDSDTAIKQPDDFSLINNNPFPLKIECIGLHSVSDFNFVLFEDSLNYKVTNLEGLGDVGCMRSFSIKPDDLSSVEWLTSCKNPLDVFLFTESSEFNAFGFKDRFYPWVADTELLAYFRSSAAIDIELDDIVDIIRSDYDGHVYNLETAFGVYSANDIILHNCRSSSTMILDGRYTLKDEGGKRPSIGDTGAKEVSSGIDYYSWLRQQPAEFIDDALGAEVGLIFRNAGLTPDEFKKVSVDGLFQPLTIEEMAQKSKKIREYINAD